MKKNLSLIVKGKRPPLFKALVEQELASIAAGEGNTYIGHPPPPPPYPGG